MPSKQVYWLLLSEIREDMSNIFQRRLNSMKLLKNLPLSLTAAFLVCLAPQFSTAQNTASETPTASSTNNSQPAVAGDTVQQMVPAEVALTRTLDARRDQSGSAFEARLDGTVHLKNGTELPHGTVLEGQVTTDRMRSNGASRLSLQFTEAKLKDGKTIPIEATIVGISGPSESGDIYGNYTGPLPWNGTTVKYDDIGVLSHVDLHSTIGATNSGTLVATDKSNMKLITGSRLSLALAEKTAD